MFAMTTQFFKGLIGQWYGSIATIPHGWVLCDGNNGTPDMRNKSVMGAGDTYAVNETGGAVDHYHGFFGLGHDHDLRSGSGIGAGNDYDVGTNDSSVSGITNTVAQLPPFRALCFIMKT